MKLLRVIFAGCLMFLLTGCFQVTTLVRVNPDGSGTVEETVLLSKKLVAKMEEAMRGFQDAVAEMATEMKGSPGTPGGNGQGAARKGGLFDLFQPDQLKKRARSMGTGVAYLSGKEIETPDYKGYVATYKFKDINTLKLSQRKLSQDGDESNAPVEFRFKKGPKPTLTMILPAVKINRSAHAAPDAGKNAPVEESAPEVFIPPDTSAGDAENVPEIYSPAPPPSQSQPLQSEQQKKEMMEMFMGMKFALAVEVNGTIVSTDATYRDGNRLTIFDFDLGKLGNATPADLEKLSAMRSGSFDEAKELLKAMPGAKVELNEKLTVVFEKTRPSGRDQWRQKPQSLR